MREIIQDDPDSEGAAQPSGTLITLPDELAEWTRQNHELILRIRNALSDTYDKLSEEQIWETIAVNCSPQWKAAWTDLRSAESEWNTLNSPENAPLGAIGQALDSDETNDVRDRYTVSLAHFTIINEGLRLRPDLRNLLSVLLVQKRMLDQSSEQTRELMMKTERLAEIASIRHDFHEAARRRVRISLQFQKYARKLFMRGDRKEKDAAASKTAPVLWLPET